MKLAKLSLAAIVAAGALTTVNAKPLEEAIKGVEFSGFIEYQNNTKNTEASKTDDGASSNDWDVLTKFVVPVADNLKVTVSGATAGNPDSNSNQTQKPLAQGFDLAKVFFTYTDGPATVIAGLQSIGAPTTDNGFNGEKGHGIVGLYNFGPATVAAAYFGNNNIDDVAGSPVNTLNVNQSDIAAVAVIGSAGPVSGRVWAVQVPTVIDSHVFAELSASVAGLSLTGQYIATKLDTAASTVYNDDSGKFYAFKAGYKFEGVGISANYVKNDKDQPIHGLANDGDTDVIGSGWRIVNTFTANTNANVLEKSYGFDLSYDYGKFGFVAGYAGAELIQSANKGVAQVTADATEVYGGVSYAYSKNFKAYVRYSDVDVDKYTAASADESFKYLRFDAKYTF